jgi:hypothetical protein
MNSAISSLLAEKGELVMEQFNVDEERQLIAFETKDLHDVINCVIELCADHCADDESRRAILKMCI